MPLVLTFLILIAVFIIIVLSTIKFEIVDFELSNICLLYTSDAADD